ncbi:hypothetical protein GE09DRAFT_1079374 [Coniochaeta sp. 2T2.1]|nr:hypothetical protein GE09DRAFT_1079374 [Coniochaeta sp. 2T2.1]
MELHHAQNQDSSASAGIRADDLAEQVKYLNEEVSYNRSRINVLEETLANLEPLRRTYSNTAPDRTARTTISDDSEFEQRYMFLDHKDTIPEVRECTFAEFKNRFRPDGKDGCYAVDVLVSGLLLHQEIQQEHKLRDRLFDGRGLTPSSQIIKNKALAKAVKMTNINNKLIKQAQSEEKWPRRIRIQSPHLLRILARVNGERWTDRPRTYYRPFNSLIYHHPHMQRALRKLERKLSGYEHEDTESVISTAATDDDSYDDDDDPVQNSPEALACLRAYMEYMDRVIMPDYRQFENMDVDSNAKVRFSDLWYLFRTGEMVYQEADGELPDRRDFRTGKRIWMTYYIDSVPERLLASATDDLEIRDVALINDARDFSVGCYYIDYDGEGFCVVKKTVKIEQFSGETPVSSLPVYPMRFCRDWKGRLDHAIKTGDSLLEYMKAKHCSYNGWTLTRSPSGESMTDVNGILQQPEHINSEVMVDFGEAFQACPAWRPHRAKLGRKMIEGLTVQEEFRIRWWSGPDRANLLGETMEQIPVRSGVTAKQRNEFVSKDPFIVAVAENTKRMKPTTEKDLTKTAKALLTGRVYAYVFTERKFAMLAVAKLRLAPKTGLALDALRIPHAIKDAIQGSIHGHFLQKAAERKIDQNWASLDLIQGKGTGLFILLHGVPGVGKTATAEAIAQANGKALFKITAGDLGMTPEKLEMSLRDIFRLASIWDCILLLDEVDTFFSQRSRADTATNKNALVSVFLRVLDYYDGVLFLTTNRAGVLDEAFISRIHSKILYQNLTLEQTLDIWKLNIQRVREIDAELAKNEERGPLQINEQELLDFAAFLFNQSSSRGRLAGRWNGRQIRNAFQVARSMAYYEHNRDRPSGPPSLAVRHFETMHEITATFDHYLTTVRGGTDAERALEEEYRNDIFHDHVTRRWQKEYHDEHHKKAGTAADTPQLGGDDNPHNPNVAVTTTVEVSDRLPQRPRMPHHLTDGDEPPVSPGNNLTPNQPHRDSIGTAGRHRSDSYRSISGPHASSPPSRDMIPDQRYQPAPSPRPGMMPMRDSSDFSGNYIPTAQPRAGIPSQNDGYGNTGYQYGSSPRNIGIPQVPRGVSPGINVYDDGMRGGGDYGPVQNFRGPQGFGQQFYNNQGNAMPESRPRYGSGGWSGGGGGGQGYGGQYTGQGRGQNADTDLSLDD